jgi:hypothetical protein
MVCVVVEGETGDDSSTITRSNDNVTVKSSSMISSITIELK